jgi:hypothetical protein
VDTLTCDMNASVRAMVIDAHVPRQLKACSWQLKFEASTPTFSASSSSSGEVTLVAEGHLVARQTQAGLPRGDTGPG